MYSFFLAPTSLENDAPLMMDAAMMSQTPVPIQHQVHVRDEAGSKVMENCPKATKIRLMIKPYRRLKQKNVAPH